MLNKHPANPDSGVIVAPRKSGGGGGGSPTQTTVQKADPWSGQQPALSNVFGTATGLAGLGGDDLTSSQQTAYNATDDFINSDQRLNYYDGSTVAPFSQDTLAAFDMQRDRALGSPLESAAQQQMTDTLGGDYLNSGNPAFTSMMDSVAGDVRSRMDAQFGASGRYCRKEHSPMGARRPYLLILPLAVLLVCLAAMSAKTSEHTNQGSGASRLEAHKSCARINPFGRTAEEAKTDCDVLVGECLAILTDKQKLWLYGARRALAWPPYNPALCRSLGIEPHQWENEKAS